MSGLASQVMENTSPVLWTADDCVRDISASPASRQLAVADASGCVSVFDIEKTSLVWSRFAHELGASLIDWCNGTELIASAGQDGYIKLWQPQTGKVAKVLQVEGLWIERLKWSPDGNYLAAAAGKLLLVWDRQGKEVVHYNEHQSTVTSIAWNCNSKEIATACYRGIHLFRIGFNKPYQSLRCLGSLIALAWSPNGKAICAGSQDRMLQYWRIANNKIQHAEMKGYPQKVNLLDWDSNSCYLASSGSNDIVVWNTQGKSPAGTVPDVLKGHQGRVSALCFQSNGLLLASGASDGSIHVWDVSQSRDSMLSWKVNSPVTRIFWINNDNQLIVGAKDGSVSQFKLIDTEEVAKA